MPVEGTDRSSAGGGAATVRVTPPAKKGDDSAKGFMRKNKLVVGIAGAGALILVLAHKGKSEPTGQAQVQAESAAVAPIVPASAPAGRPENGGGGGGGGSEGGGSSGGGGGSAAGSTSAPGTGGEAGAEDAALATQVGAVASAIKESGEATEDVAGAIEHQTGGTAKHKASNKPKGKSKTHKHTTKATHHTGTTVHGRHFPGATGHTMGRSHKNSNGNTSQVVHVHYGGKSTTHISHNGGKSWTDHPAGHTPPSRTTAHQSHPANKPAEAVHHSAPKPAPAPRRVDKPVEHKRKGRRA